MAKIKLDPQGYATKGEAPTRKSSVQIAKEVLAKTTPPRSSKKKAPAKKPAKGK
ncbi:MAG TPA: hypothetical protein VGN72_04335 [Tepidisphaeraceae bacterium]|jgi:hypothetical protein|nr:hypothetical protein [Tepidisphaeraceae bacterium]